MTVVPYVVLLGMDINEAINEIKECGSMRFKRLNTILVNFFDGPRIRGSHHIYKTPWRGMPFLNIQPSGGSVKDYQLKQALQCLIKLKEQLNG